MVSANPRPLWWKSTPRPSCPAPPLLGERRSDSGKAMGAGLQAGPRQVRERGEEADPHPPLARQHDQYPLQAAVAPDRVTNRRGGDDAEGERAYLRHGEESEGPGPVGDETRAPEERDGLAGPHLARVAAPGDLLDPHIALAHDQLPGLEDQEKRRQEGKDAHAPMLDSRRPPDNNLRLGCACPPGGRLLSLSTRCLYVLSLSMTKSYSGRCFPQL